MPGYGDVLATEHHAKRAGTKVLALFVRFGFRPASGSGDPVPLPPPDVDPDDDKSCA